MIPYRSTSIPYTTPYISNPVLGNFYFLMISAVLDDICTCLNEKKNEKKNFNVTSSGGFVREKNKIK